MEEKENHCKFYVEEKEAKHFKFYMENPDVHPFFLPMLLVRFQRKAFEAASSCFAPCFLLN